MTGVTVVLPSQPAVAAIDVRGGGPGTRESDALGLSGTVDEVHAIVLSGGSAFGLAAASGVQAWLAERGIGFPVGTARVPIVPQAILFDLLNGGRSDPAQSADYVSLARSACDAARADMEPGSVGAGFGATTATLRGGLGTASEMLADGLTVGAVAAVNAVGSATIGDGPHFWAAPFERGREFGGLGFPSPWPTDATMVRLKGAAAENTTLAVVATNAKLDKRQCYRLAVMAQTGIARALYPVHTPLDGDVVFAMATGQWLMACQPVALARLGAAAASCLARAVARGVYAADAAPSGWLGPPAYRTHFGAPP
jgi:L-aminopeptidase/D-esterase-like protein